MSDFALLCQAHRAAREERLAHHVAMVDNVPLCSASIEALEQYAAQLAGGLWLPVGSVEFVRRAMALAGIVEPANLSYPDVLRPYLHREVSQRQAGSVIGRRFIKPVATKVFTGFVFDALDDPVDLGEHDRAQCEAFLALDPSTPVWVSEPVRWRSEVRFYVLDGQVVGEGRYDEGPEDALLPERFTVHEMLERFSGDPGAPAAFAIDAGVLECGATALVEVNDAWALGFYSGTLGPREYLQMLWRRWRQMLSTNRSLPDFPSKTGVCSCP